MSSHDAQYPHASDSQSDTEVSVRFGWLDMQQACAGRQYEKCASIIEQWVNSTQPAPDIPWLLCFTELWSAASQERSEGNPISCHRVLDALRLMGPSLHSALALSSPTADETDSSQFWLGQWENMMVDIEALDNEHDPRLDAEITLILVESLCAFKPEMSACRTVLSSEFFWALQCERGRDVKAEDMGFLGLTCRDLFDAFLTPGSGVMHLAIPVLSLLDAVANDIGIRSKIRSDGSDSAGLGNNDLQADYRPASADQGSVKRLLAAGLIVSPSELIAMTCVMNPFSRRNFPGEAIIQSDVAKGEPPIQARNSCFEAIFCVVLSVADGMQRLSTDVVADINLHLGLNTLCKAASQLEGGYGLSTEEAATADMLTRIQASLEAIKVKQPDPENPSWRGAVDSIEMMRDIVYRQYSENKAATTTSYLGFENNSGEEVADTYFF